MRPHFFNILPLFMLLGPVYCEEILKELSLDPGKGPRIDLVLIPAGIFEMGSLESEEGRRKTETRHTVTLTKPFYMGKFEITQEQYEAVMGENPSSVKGLTLPVERVTWDEATKFCEKLSEKTQRIAQLPTEAQWEYACRAGTSTPYNTGPTLAPTDANFTPAITVVPAPVSTITVPALPATPVPVVPNASDAAVAVTPISPAVEAALPLRPKTMPVGSFKPNAFGLFDMHGNVWEWCRDWHDENFYTTAAVQDPEGPAKSTDETPSRVVRGGSYFSVAAEVRSACRDNQVPSYRNAHGGFRICVQADK